ncbi:MAG: response regulator transcription factor [Oscillospiraceae bacterium]|nr:response regulator transcription factor [Oscillospiraceae bacterium]
MKILIAEDEPALRHALETLLQRNNYCAESVSNGTDALDYLRIGSYDAAILDIMMPKMDGIQVVKNLRQEGNTTPVLLLTAKSSVEDRVLGLDTGANDYLTKPFDIRELLARLRVLTRQQDQQSSRIRVGNITLDRASFLLTGPTGTQSLVNKEYQVLLLLIQNPGQTISADRFLETVWEPDSIGQENALWTVIYNLRKKLTAVGADLQIKTKRHLGYTLEKCL